MTKSGIFIAISTVAIFISCIISAQDKTDSLLEKLSNIKYTDHAYTNPSPIAPEVELPKLIGLPPTQINPIIVSKYTRQRFNLNFTVKIDYSLHSSNYLANIVIERKNDLENLSTISLHLGELFSDESNFMPKYSGDLNVQIWQSLRVPNLLEQDRDIYLNLSIKPELINKSYLILDSSTIIPNSFGLKSSSKPIYIIDLNSFVPTHQKKKSHNVKQANGKEKDTVKIDFD